MKVQKQSIRVYDNFCTKTAEVRESFLQSGFGKWTPNKGLVGSSIYEGMNYTGLHSYLLGALTVVMGGPIFPNSMFARVTNKDTEKAYVHSDRNDGAYTCLVYLSDHDEISGTGFYRHRKTGMTEMPSFSEMRSDGIIDQLGREMVDGDEKVWEQLDFVRGLFNRAVIFHAPLFHSRFPKHGMGTTVEDGRMIWGCHFHTIETLNKELNLPSRSPSVKEGIEQDRADFQEFVKELGLTQSDMDRAKTDFIDCPNDWIKVKSSDIDGVGVFASKVIKPDEPIASAWTSGRWTNWGRFANHSLTPTVKPKVGCGGVDFISTQTIEPEEEITVNYRDMRQAVKEVSHV